ncbi:SAM-dependent methyltransferase [Salinarchaeum sp. Harcht-Bsk1]|uniref:class I SAM-dependent methyltransferase n=1 Tax=Salinarchaeum sp. Harcht-Bsk1 TaxID=1333523 RepID=UPI0003423260|nr:class I SAM-dependent methyltransferase [Salinarchaeum sp. Harcht-Bsk1]AGN02605.1 SAM-dependent methyltransferase [Salinarchaeum sp. Harcht-Bsk1]
MSTVAPFEEHTDRYDGWFEDHEHAYRSELAALDRLVPATGHGVEIGVGTGRFAAPLGIQVGLDPSRKMLERARERGIDVVQGVAEALPFANGTFDTALLVTTICFVDDVAQTFSEAARILDPDGALVIGFIDANSPVGRIYREKQEQNPFYRDATFVTTAELVEALRTAGFGDLTFVQTIYEWPGEIDEPEPVESGYGEGSFVGIEATL